MKLVPGAVLETTMPRYKLGFYLVKLTRKTKKELQSRLWKKSVALRGRDVIHHPSPDVSSWFYSASGMFFVCVRFYHILLYCQAKHYVSDTTLRDTTLRVCIHFTENTAPRVANAFVCIFKHERLPAIAFTMTRIAITFIVKKVSTLWANIFSINQNLFINFVGHNSLTSYCCYWLDWI